MGAAPAPGAGVTTFLLALALAAAPPADSSSTTTVMVVVGAPGTPEYGARFAAWADHWKTLSGKAGASYVAVGLEPAGAAADRQRLAEAIARESGPSRGPLWLVLIGHGTFDGRAAKLNLRGPDVSADELAAWLHPVSRPLVVIDATSASGPFVKALSGPGRVIITATRSGHEQNATRLGGLVVDALSDPQADLDKDGETSLLEAFLVASRRVEAAFTEVGLLPTEHALLDDNGDGLGTAAGLYHGLRPTAVPAGATPDGRRAHQLHLLPSEPEKAMPAELRRRRDQIELEVLHLRDGRPRMSDDEYYRRVEPLLLEMARLYRKSERQER
jgi:hypothetical protein